MTPGRPARYWRTIRHLPLRQIAWLAWRRLARQPRRVPAPRDARPRVAARLPPAVPLARPVRLGGNRFEFLNQARDFGASVDWAAPGMSRLWLYNLHYFDWLRQSDVDDEARLALARSWIAANPPFTGTGWEPYPLSLRLVNWTRVFPGRDTEPAIAASMALQAAWLERNLEHHLRANHLFANLKALVFAGTWFDGGFGERLLGRGWPLIERELDEQFLADGGHFERSPMYHMVLSADLFELSALIADNAVLFPPGAAAALDTRARRALEFAREIVLPHDQLPRFNDSVQGIAPTLVLLEAYAADNCGWQAPSSASGRRLVRLDASGYYGVRDGDDAVLIDAGDIGPAYQPGHAHCDLLSFELCMDARRLLANCGNHDYEPGAERAFARSTRAHNTVVVDGEEQSEIWGSFRVGRRASPLHAGLEAHGETVVFTGSHDGYRHLAGAVTHTREIKVEPDFTVCVRDRIEGGGRHRAVSHLHFAPGFTLVPCDRAFEVHSDNGAIVAALDDISAGDVSLEETDRYPEFGIRERGMTVLMGGSGTLPLELGFTVRKAV